MAELRAAVTDTHPLLFHAPGTGRLGRRAARLFAGAEARPAVSNPAYQPVDLTPEQVYLAAEERPNDDPFDGLGCATARHLALPLVTRDGDITDSGLVRVIW